MELVATFISIDMDVATFISIDMALLTCSMFQGGQGSGMGGQI